MIPEYLKTAVLTALSLLPQKMDTPDARLALYAISKQETPNGDRRQLIKVDGKLVPQGPAKGLWQFERGGGCLGVVNHRASRELMQQFCKARDVEFTSAALWNAIEFDDVLAAAAARLLLYTDPRPLPARGDVEGLWKVYTSVWRPGALARQPKELRAKWDKSYNQALTA